VASGIKPLALVNKSWIFSFNTGLLPYIIEHKVTISEDVDKI